MLEHQLATLYTKRFPEGLRERRREVWKCLYDHWFSRYIAPNDKVLEIAPGYCEFINNVDASHERVGIDLNPDSRTFAAPGVILHHISAERMADVLPAEHFDVAFASNFFEHCQSREQLLAVLRATWTVLKPRGKLLILGPNLKYTLKNYFDYFDHHLPLTDVSMAEALSLVGFTVSEQLPKTLPFTMRGRLPSHPWLVAMYLRLPIAWKLFGSQFFIVAQR